VRLGYITNGFPRHTLTEALTLLEQIGYRAVGVTLERSLLDPPNPDGVAACVRRIGPLLAASGFDVTIETGARYILDDRRKHHPTLVSAVPDDRRRRIDFLLAAVDIAAEVGAESVSLWSGAADDDASEAVVFDRLMAGLDPVLRRAERRGVRLAFEPEPGMVVDTMARFERLFEAVEHPAFGLTLDVGHVICLGDGTPSEHIQRWRDCLWNVHIEDMVPGLHEHRMFGEGAVDFAEVFDAMGAIGYAGPVHVELSRHGGDAERAARASMAFFRRHGVDG
jgi:sugar phosphate isomerase/epimerase